MQGGGTYTCLVVDGRRVGGAMAPPQPGIPPYWAVYFDVESVDDAVAWAEHLGGTVVVPTFDVPGVGRLAVLADPQGGDVQPDAVPAERREPHSARKGSAG